MTADLGDGLPEALQEVRTRCLFVMRLDVRPLQIIGAMPGAYRRVGTVPSGAFDGERLSGQVLEGGCDWQNVRSDGSTTLDVRLVLKTSDDALIAADTSRRVMGRSRLTIPRNLSRWLLAFHKVDKVRGEKVYKRSELRREMPARRP
jgi:hypothetical protein